MKGLLTDVNVQGLIPSLRAALDALGMSPILEDIGLELYAFPDFGLDRHLDDRQLWNFCQRERLVLLTDNRNDYGPDSLEATIRDSLQPDSLPVLTAGNKERLQHERSYQVRVAANVAEILFDISLSGEHLGVGRLWVPHNQPGSVSGRTT